MNDLLLWAPQAWTDGRWQFGVCLPVDSQGNWGDIATDIHNPPSAAVVLAGPVLPGLVNAHSHAFQRAFAGMSERRETDVDDFWSWRERMYQVALRITPTQLRAVAAQLYIEMLRGGYTQVCEFHYLHHAENGQPYGDAATLSWAIADAAGDAGMGLTILPVLYERAGFNETGLRDEQRRFAGTANSIHDLYRQIRAARRVYVNAGVAIHSLRAVASDSIRELLRLLGDDNAPIHIHVAEQLQEVEDCLAVTGNRPIEWLCRNFQLDARWQLVHATHATQAEVAAVARAKAGVVICPSTEANLGDGIIDLPAWLNANVAIAIGSDSHVSRDGMSELRLLEYAQRLTLRRRNVAAAPAAGLPSTAANLFARALNGGGKAAGFSSWGLVKGARADALVIETSAPALLGLPLEYTLDALLFASDAPAIRDVYVAGKRVIADGVHPDQRSIAEKFSIAMKEIWQ